MSAQSSDAVLSGISLVPPTAAEPEVRTAMRVRKRNGSFEPVDVNKIVRAVARCCVSLPEVDAMRVATKTISGLYDGATTSELDRLSIQTAALLTAARPMIGYAGWRAIRFSRCSLHGVGIRHRPGRRSSRTDRSDQGTLSGVGCEVAGAT